MYARRGNGSLTYELYTFDQKYGSSRLNLFTPLHKYTPNEIIKMTQINLVSRNQLQNL